MRNASRAATQQSSRTRERLVAAASDEFREHGVFGTDTNRIARRAGFAPQTFYRWFDDKIDVLLAVYRSWQEAERALIERLLSGPPRALVDAIIAHHRDYLLFRRSLRQLAVENASVREARTDSRLRQFQQIRAWNPQLRLPRGELAAALLQIERLCDAIAEGEFEDLQCSDQPARREIARLIAMLRSSGRDAPAA